MPLFIEQLNLFDEAPTRERIAEDWDSPDVLSALPSQSAASSARLIADLLKRYEALVGFYIRAVEVNVSDEEATEFHSDVIDAASNYADELRRYWPGLRYRYRD